MEPFAISVIIPMYNAAEYVGECLDSLLLQTFRNFEVIVVDDCSTDDSVKIVEGYAPKFLGRLQITQTETNSGGCAIPRNVGFPLSRGEYVFFMDADDIIIETAFEEVYALAKKYNAEIVYCEKYYMSEGVGQKFKDNIHIAESRIQKPPFVVEPTLESYDLEERVKKLLQWNYWMTAWLKFVRRDLLIEHNIKFPPTFISEDDIWSLKLLFCSKRFLRIPTPYYVRRIREDSIMGRDRNALDQIKRWLDVIIRCLKDLDNFMGGIEFFRDNPRYRYEILDRSLNASFGSAFDKLKDESDANLYSIFQQNFGEYLGDNDVLVSALCARAMAQRKDLENEKRYAQDIQKRVTLKEAELEHLKAKLEFISPLAPLQSDVPAISVIIPMYNVEKYIGECLDCLVMQTFQDFEVIVVDDCSTDSSFFAAKRYLPKFNGRLRIVKTEENSGGGGIPRNLGLELAKGEYILFVDADDFILWNTLEILYTAAKKYDTDVVYTSAYYLLHHPNEIRTIRDGIGSKLLKENLEDETNLIVDDQNKLLQQLVFERAFNFAVMHFVRRDFLLQNNIVFTKIFNGEDHLWVIQVCCHSKRFFRTTTPFYFYRRYDSGSISVQEREPDEQISHWILGFSNWLKLLNALENKEQILKDNPAYCFAAAKRNFEWCLNRINNARDKISNEEICDVLYHAFANESDNLVVPFLFSILDQRTRETAQLKQQIAEQQAEFRDVILIITARIDIQFVPKTGRGDFQILSVSDDKANVDKPAWFQKGGIGYQIESFARKMEIVAKVTTDGRINMKLRGVDVSNPADKSKRVPYWIDYTKLTINGKKVIDKLTPAWHGKPYNYSFDAKANAEIKIEVEWLPHKNDT